MSDGLHRAVMGARAFSNSTKVQKADVAADEAPVLCELAGKVGVISLNRPSVFNALNLPMVRTLNPVYKDWQTNPNIAAVLMLGKGPKAFCAGGDVVAIRTAGVEKRPMSEVVQFFREEYQLNYSIATAAKPQVALLHGFTMGGGVGLSVHGKYRVATDNTAFAMPETAIGLFPDVGGTYFLPRLPGALGMYLALTGNRLSAKEVFDAHVATHFVPLAKLPELDAALRTVSSGQEVEAVLSRYASNEPRKPLPNQEAIDRIFSKGSVKEIYQSLVEEKSEWANAQIKALDQASKFSLMLTFSLLQHGKKLSIADCLKMEFRAAVRCMQQGDFYEGVRAKLVDKVKTPPNFRQDTFDSFDFKQIELGDDLLKSVDCPELHLV